MKVPESSASASSRMSSMRSCRAPGDVPLRNERMAFITSTTVISVGGRISPGPVPDGGLLGRGPWRFGWSALRAFMVSSLRGRWRAARRVASALLYWPARTRASARSRTAVSLKPAFAADVFGLCLATASRRS